MNYRETTKDKAEYLLCSKEGTTIKYLEPYELPTKEQIVEILKAH